MDSGSHSEQRARGCIGMTENPEIEKVRRANEQKGRDEWTH